MYKWIWLDSNLYPDNQITRYSLFHENGPENYTVAEFAKTYESVIPEPQLGDVLLMGGVLLGGYIKSLIILILRLLLFFKFQFVDDIIILSCLLRLI